MLTVYIVEFPVAYEELSFDFDDELLVSTAELVR